ncbi:MAG: YunC family protein [Candidatus Omnitrophota bacterium]|nr:YunC family protein [Candidatus Omnitrophota bacterium]
MEAKKIQVANRQVDGFVIPLGIGPVNLVFMITDKGMLGCSAFNVAALDKFNYPAAIVRLRDGKPIVSLDDLLAGLIKEANNSAQAVGIKVDMQASEALAKL